MDNLKRSLWIVGRNNCHYSVKWSEDKQLFVATVKEFPSLVSEGKTKKSALRKIKSIVNTFIFFEDIPDEMDEFDALMRSL